MQRSILFSFLVIAASASSVAFAADDAGASGAASFQRCAACHLPDGAGVPGAYPAFRENILTLAGAESGRDYLTFVVRKGVSGEIEVDGVSYYGVMPAVAADLNDEKIAALLNYLVATIAPGGKADAADAPQQTPFTAEEIVARSKTVLGAHTQQGVLALRAAAMAATNPTPPGEAQ